MRFKDYLKEQTSKSDLDPSLLSLMRKLGLSNVITRIDANTPLVTVVFVKGTAFHLDRGALDFLKKEKRFEFIFPQGKEIGFRFDEE